MDLFIPGSQSIKFLLQNHIYHIPWFELVRYCNPAAPFKLLFIPQGASDHDFTTNSKIMSGDANQTHTT